MNQATLAADPTFADAYNLRGLVTCLDDAGLAEDSFRRAIALNPRGPTRCTTTAGSSASRIAMRMRRSSFSAALAVPTYTGRAKTLMTQGVCQLRAGQRAEAERSLTQA